MSGTSVFLLLFCIALEIARELCFKLGVDQDEAQEEDTGFLHMLATTPLLWLGIIIWGVEMIAWIQVLEYVPLNVAFPMVSVVYCGVPLASRWLLGESVTRRHWVGTACITFGVALVGLTGI